MNTKFNWIKYLLFAFVAIGFSSCLKSGLGDLPAFDQADISNIFLEYRYHDPGKEWIDGSKIVKFQRLGVAKEIIPAKGTEDNSVVVTATIPAANGTFTEEERQKVTLTNIVVYLNISTAATIKPLDNSPVLGVPGDFSSPRKYRITAADGKTFRDWVIAIKPLIK